MGRTKWLMRGIGRIHENSLDRILIYGSGEDSPDFQDRQPLELGPKGNQFIGIQQVFDIRSY